MAAVEEGGRVIVSFLCARALNLCHIIYINLEYITTLLYRYPVGPICIKREKGLFQTLKDFGYSDILIIYLYE